MTRSIAVLAALTVVVVLLLLLPELLALPLSFGYTPLLLPLLFFGGGVVPVLIAARGSNLEPEDSMNMVMGAVAVKMIFALLVALLWFLILKKSSTTDLLLFFVVYLAFSVTTVALVIRVIRPLK